MSHTNSIKRSSAEGAIVLALLLACLGLVACGGSSKSSSTSANAAVTGSTSTTKAGGSGKPTGGPSANRFTSLRECLRKKGITQPKSAPGQRAPGGVGGSLGGGAAGPRLPKGMTRAQYEAALKKCGGNAFAGGAGRRLSSPLFKAALTRFATCMREHGVGMPAPNTSGTGPIFSTKGIDTASAQFKAAEIKCSSDLRNSFQGRAGAGGAPGGTGANGAPGGKGTNGAPGGAAQGSAG